MAKEGDETLVLHNLPFDDYLRIPAVNSSRLKLIRSESPKFFFENPNQSGTRSMGLGTLCHTAVLEPSELRKRYVTCPSGMDEDGRKKPFKDYKKSLAPGKILIKRAEMQLALDLAEDVHTYQEKFFPVDASNITELTIVWTDPDTGLRCKVRPDNYIPGAVMDLKCMAAISTSKFPWACSNYGYWEQSASYRMGVLAAVEAGLLPAGDNGDCEMFIIASSTGKVRDHARYRVQDAEITHFTQVVQDNLMMVREWHDSGHWGGLADSGTISLNYPGRLEEPEFEEDDLGLEAGDWG